MSLGSWNPKKNKEWQPRGRGQHSTKSAGSQDDSPCDREIMPELKDIKSLPNVDPFIKELFSFPPKNLPLAGRLSCCTKNWAKLTSDPENL